MFVVSLDDVPLGIFPSKRVASACIPGCSLRSLIDQNITNETVYDWPVSSVQSLPAKLTITVPKHLPKNITFFEKKDSEYLKTKIKKRVHILEY